MTDYHLHALTWRALATGALSVLAAAHTPAVAQQPVTRRDAARAALAAGSRIALARADTAAARAALLTARALPNPTFATTYTGAVPKRHLQLDIPFDAPWVRGPRVASANAVTRAARLRFLSERAAAVLDVDTTYTRALAADARFRLSRQTARDADSLRKMTVARRDVGDASDLDVDLATVTAGQQANVAATDAIAYSSALLTVQTLMGIPADSVAIALADSLRLTPTATDSLLGGMAGDPAGAAVPGVGTLPSVAAAEASLQAAELAITRERRTMWGLPSVVVGAEWDDSAEDPPNKKLPVIGVAVPLPIFNRNQGPIAQAQADRDRARAELTAARLASHQRIAELLRARETLSAKVARDQEQVARAERVASRSLTAYREGASALPAVLEARRTAREVLGQYIDDLAALLNAQSELRVLTRTESPQ